MTAEQAVDLALFSDNQEDKDGFLGWSWRGCAWRRPSERGSVKKVIWWAWSFSGLLWLLQLEARAEEEQQETTTTTTAPANNCSASPISRSRQVAVGTAASTSGPRLLSPTSHGPRQAPQSAAAASERPLPGGQRGRPSKLWWTAYLREREWEGKSERSREAEGLGLLLPGHPRRRCRRRDFRNGPGITLAGSAAESQKVSVWFPGSHS